MLGPFNDWLIQNETPQGSIPPITSAAASYLSWYSETFGAELTQLLRVNVMDYCSRMQSEYNANEARINGILYALTQFDMFLTETGRQPRRALGDSEFMTPHSRFFDTDRSDRVILTEKEVESFRQLILCETGIRNYAFITLMAYAGLRVSEMLNLMKRDADLPNRRLYIARLNNYNERTVTINDKVYNALSEYMAGSDITGKWLFPGRSERGKFSRIQVFRICKDYSDKINPARLRHFYCINAMRQGLSLKEIASQAGYANAYGALLGVLRSDYKQLDFYRIFELGNM